MSLIWRARRRFAATINSRFFYNRRYRRLVEAMYYRPSLLMPSVPISSRAEMYLEELRENGVVVIPGLFPEAADAINEHYFGVLEGRREAEPGRVINDKDLGVRNQNSGSKTVTVSYCDPILQPVFWDPDVCGIIYNYYRGQPYYRDQAMLALNAPKAEVDQRVEFSSKFHVDHHHQMTTQFIVNDITAEGTRLQYAVGSHRDRNVSWDRFAYDDSEVLNRYQIKDCVGPRGTMIIMDAGAGLHRGHYVPGTVRKSIGTAIDAGHSMNTYGKVDSVKNWDAYKSFPRHMQRMMNRVKI